MTQPRRNWQADLKRFRERMGGLSEEKKAWAKKQMDELRAIRKALKQGPRTVPTLIAETHLPGPRVMWYVMALKRYGEVGEAGLEGSYLRYFLKEAKP